MTPITSFYREECEKIDPSDIDAKLELELNPLHKNELILKNPWGDTSVDLTDAVKKLETNTHLFLSPVENPVALQYNRERDEPGCINGEDLGRIIPMTSLKDVNQEISPKNGDIYIYENGAFKPFNLAAALKNLQDQINVINNTIAKPEGVPADTRVCYGNINLYSDYTNAGDHTHGIFTHNIADEVANDEYFA